ncbi:GNAT family N-acetyltransferase [Thermaerobacter sp. PB12/4term]|uniref:GNAT family N-acetyltransferase n=1 Tax=Thermaerobacter sp. PB12/4term TaxID=2293838 RepID=UPI000E32B7A2|nr:GNAT family N-acetyltransferase [Thermaerobacter sp. PB12/4term]QIA26724.1 GNAT family N-acetyltransferase [Thermaerobacter sp. PB12/4term]
MAVNSMPSKPPQGTRVTVRPAEPRDFEAVTRLLEELGRPAVPPEAEAAAREVYLRHLHRPDTASLVAELDGRVVGFMSLEFRDRLNQLRPQAWIPDLIVTESARGLGIGKALLQRGMELARERNCWSITLESGHHRKVAHQLYRAVGMRDEGLFFRLHF